jgi:hypothetical protein
MCPAIGSGVPRFRDELHQIPARNCFAYAIGGNEAMAQCTEGPARGPIDAELTKVIDDLYVYNPRFSPDGTRAIVSYYNTTSGYYELADYAITTAGAQRVTTYTPTNANYVFFEFSTPSAGPDRRVVYAQWNYSTSIGELIELSDTGSGWTELRRYPMSELGTTVYTVAKPSLSRDGLRLVFIGSEQAGGTTGEDSPPTTYTQPVMYADRASLDAHFGPAVIVDSVPDLVSWPFMTDDCARIYFNALNRIFYLEQLR